jgi:hypothetical protein
MTQALFFTPTQPNSPWVPGETFKVSAYYTVTSGTALGSGDTITWQNAVPTSGVTSIEASVVCTQLDSNASPTFTYDFGDTLSGDLTNGLSRYILAGKGGSNVSGAVIATPSNVPPVSSAGVQTKGIGFSYATTENSTGDTNGATDLVFTGTAANATGATTYTVWAYFTYYCGGEA